MFAGDNPGDCDGEYDVCDSGDVGDCGQSDWPFLYCVMEAPCGRHQ